MAPKTGSGQIPIQSRGGEREGDVGREWGDLSRYFGCVGDKGEGEVGRPARLIGPVGLAAFCFDFFVVAFSFYFIYLLPFLFTHFKYENGTDFETT